LYADQTTYILFCVGNIFSEVKKRWRAMRLEEIRVDLMTCANTLGIMRKIIQMAFDAKLSTSILLLIN
jgi:hypothetical protein